MTEIAPVSRTRIPDLDALFGSEGFDPVRWPSGNRVIVQRML